MSQRYSYAPGSNPPSQGSYPSQPQPSYAPQQGGYAPQPSGYPSTSPQPSGYPGQPAGYAPQGGYAPQPSGYPSTSPQPSGYSPSAPQPSGYPTQPGYPPQAQPSYGAQPSGYPSSAPQPSGYPSTSPQPSGYPGQSPYPSQPSAPTYPGASAPPTSGGYYPSQAPSQQGAGSGGMWFNQQYGAADPSQGGNFQQFFGYADTQRRGQINAQELLTALQYLGHSFTYPTAARLIAVFDADKSGTISMAEFVPLCNFVTSLHNRFRSVDRGQEGMMDFHELENALRQEGFVFEARTLRGLYDKFSQGNTSGLTFENFLQLACLLGSIRSQFQWRDSARSGQVSLSLNELVDIVTSVFSA